MINVLYEKDRVILDNCVFFNNNFEIKKNNMLEILVINV